MGINWNEAPEGATHCITSPGANVWYRDNGNGERLDWWYDTHWTQSNHYHVDCVLGKSAVTPRPAAQRPTQNAYTRDEALQFLVERLDSWPTDIADAPLCPGWGWSCGYGPIKQFTSTVDGEKIFETSWNHARKEARDTFTPFVSLEDAQPAPDMVNHPPHYQSDNGIECIDAIRAALGRDGFIAYCTGNAIKYQWRDKNDRAEDLRKAAWYMNRAIQEVGK